MEGGSVDELLGPTVERSALDQLQIEISTSITQKPPICSFDSA
jgi:hypothetical protein